MTVTGPDVLQVTLARDAMHAPIAAVDPSATLRDVAALMGGLRIHSVVVDGLVRTATGERLVWGIVSDQDVVRAIADGCEDTTAGDIAATEALTVDAADDLTSVSRLLTEHGCAHVIVVDHERPVGIVSTLDVVSVFGG